MRRSQSIYMQVADPGSLRRGWLGFGNTAPYHSYGRYHDHKRDTANFFIYSFKRHMTIRQPSAADTNHPILMTFNPFLIAELLRSGSWTCSPSSHKQGIV